MREKNKKNKETTTKEKKEKKRKKNKQTKVSSLEKIPTICYTEFPLCHIFSQYLSQSSISSSPNLL